MGTAPVIKRLGAIGITSVLAIVLLACWLLRYSTGERTLPSLVGNESNPKVKLRQGTYVGNEVKEETFSQTLEQFLGIPYGQSTAGERRFREPISVGASTETFDAKDYGNHCPAGFPVQISEDCLNLNIWRPKKRADGKKLPVLVHIYGGSFNFGFAQTRQISNMVAWSSEPFIGLSFNYRVGALGFLPSNLTAHEGLCNAGLKDQALLLQWVQENIVEFGGNPDDVTLMGSSAGAHSLGHHLMHNPTKPSLFHKLIIESGGPTARAVYTPNNPLHELQFQELLTSLSLQTTAPSQLMQDLRYLPSSSIKAASEEIFNAYNPSVRWPFQPVIDGPGGFIEQSPISAFRSAKFHKVPILTGFNTNEGASFVPASIGTAKEFRDFFHTLLPSLTPEDLDKLEEVYPDPLIHPSSPYKETRPGLGAQFKRTEQAYGHFGYTCPVRMTAHFASSRDVPAYLYQFAVSSSVKGAEHGTNNPFPTYNQNIRDVSSTMDEVAGSMHAYWTSFVTTGDPNKIKGRFPQRPVWPRYEKEGVGRKVIFGEGNDEIAGGGNAGVAVQVGDDVFAREECEFWWDRTDKFEV